METQIIEYKVNYFQRLFLKCIFIFLLIIGIVFIIMELFLKDYFILALGIIFVAIGLYSFKSVAKIKKIKGDSILIGYGNKEHEIFLNQINYLFKSVPYPFANRYGILISSNVKGINKYLIVFNEPEIDFLNIMKKSGVKIKNMG